MFSPALPTPSRSKSSLFAVAASRQHPGYERADGNRAGERQRYVSKVSGSRAGVMLVLIIPYEHIEHCIGTLHLTVLYGRQQHVCNKKRNCDASVTNTPQQARRRQVYGAKMTFVYPEIPYDYFSSESHVGESFDARVSMFRQPLIPTLIHGLPLLS